MQILQGYFRYLLLCRNCFSSKSPIGDLHSIENIVVFAFKRFLSLIYIVVCYMSKILIQAEMHLLLSCYILNLVIHQRQKLSWLIMFFSLLFLSLLYSSGWKFALSCALEPFQDLSGLWFQQLLCDSFFLFSSCSCPLYTLKGLNTTLISSWIGQDQISLNLFHLEISVLSE